VTNITLVCLIFHLILINIGVINPTIGIISPTVIGALMTYRGLAQPDKGAPGSALPRNSQFKIFRRHSLFYL
jgi:hypothetical protein